MTTKPGRFGAHAGVGSSTGPNRRLLPIVLVVSALALGASARASEFEATIPVTGSQPVNLRELANAAGYNGVADASITFEVGSGVTITGDGGSPAGGIAIDSGSWPTSGYAIAITLAVRSGGSVLGGGGAGGSGNGQPGGPGGDAVYCRIPMSITVDYGGAIRAGGGGGGSGGRGYYGGYVTQIFYGGGGGGGGFPNGPGGGGGGGDQEGGLGGAAGKEASGGLGGAGASPGGTGGAGGVSNAGSSGGDSWEPGGTGGGAGYAIRKNGNSVTVINNGTIVGVQG